VCVCVRVCTFVRSHMSHSIALILSPNGVFVQIIASLVLSYDLCIHTQTYIHTHIRTHTYIYTHTHRERQREKDIHFESAVEFALLYTDYVTPVWKFSQDRCFMNGYSYV